MPKKGGKRTKSRTHDTGPPVGANLPEDSAKAGEPNVPRSIVAKVNKVSPVVGELVRDLRKLMGPYTADKLREKRYNRMKDYAGVAGQLGVTHLLIVSQTEKNVVLRVARTPDGPTLHFRINQYSLARQVHMTQKRPFESTAAFLSPPLVVLNNFSQSVESHTKLMRVTFQHLFPTINIKTVKLNECRRVVLFHLLEDGQVEMRHYAIRANPVGVSKSVKRLIQAQKIPNLGALEDISQYVEGGSVGAGGSVSDSEAEDEGSRVVLPDRFVGRGNAKSQQSAMKLTELGPRLKLELFKVEQGVNEGDILYHKFVQKTPEEAALLKAKVEKARLLKDQRRAEQEANVKRKRDLKEEKLQAKKERKRQKLEGGAVAEEEEEEEEEDDDDDDDDDDGDDDEEDDEADDGEYDEEEEEEEDDDDEEEEEEEEDA